jgi:hypothetical protein
MRCNKADLCYQSPARKSKIIQEDHVCRPLPQSTNMQKIKLFILLCRTTAQKWRIGHNHNAVIFLESYRGIPDARIPDTDLFAAGIRNISATEGKRHKDIVPDPKNHFFELRGIVIDFTPDPGSHVIGAIDPDNRIGHIGSAIIVVFVIGLHLMGLKGPGNFIVVFQATIVFKTTADHGGYNQNVERNTKSQQKTVFIFCPYIIHSSLYLENISRRSEDGFDVQSLLFRYAV